MSTIAEIPLGCRVDDIATPIPKNIYVPGTGGNRVWSAGSLCLGSDLFELTMGQLAFLGANPTHPLTQKVDVQCGKPIWRETKTGYEKTDRICENRFSCIRAFSTVTACDECREAWLERDRMDRMAATWRSLCPASFRDTDKTHAGFPKAQYERLRAWNGEMSLFFYGPKRTGKTRLAMMMLKRALVHGKTVGVLWPEKLDRINPRFEKEDPVEVWGRYDLLLIDDALLTAKTAQLASFLKNLVDYLMRHKRRFIITSQVNGDDYIAHINKGGESSRVDADTAEALMGRIREECSAGSDAQVSFAQAVPKQDEQPF